MERLGRHLLRRKELFCLINYRAENAYSGAALIVKAHCTYLRVYNNSDVKNTIIFLFVSEKIHRFERKLLHAVNFALYTTRTHKNCKELFSIDTDQKTTFMFCIVAICDTEW